MKLTQVEKNWDAVFRSFSSQLKTVNPFAYTFSDTKWQAIYKTAFNATALTQ